MVLSRLPGLASSMALAWVSAWGTFLGSDIHRTSQNSLRTDARVLCKRVRSAETRDGIMAEPGTEDQPTRV